MKPHEADIDLQRQRLGAWLETWQLQQRLETLADPPEPPAPPAPQIYLPASRSTKGASAASGVHPGRLLAGAIILLPPDNEATRARPVYVALVEALRGDSWLVVPFGRFPFPALPGELATGRAAAPLQVLCVWNHAPIAAERLARGWQVGRLCAREQRWLRQLLDLPPGRAPRKPLARRLGPPLVHPLDPRHDYIEQERMLWLAGEAPSRCGESTIPYTADDSGGLPLAADEVDDTYRD